MTTTSRMTDQFKDVPEWKKAVHGAGARTGAIGKKIVRSIIEQRQSLPIYKLKDELLKVILLFNLILFTTLKAICQLGSARSVFN